MYVLLVCLMKLEIELVGTHPPPKTIAKNNFWILFLPASNPNPSNTSHLYLSSSLYFLEIKRENPPKPTIYPPLSLSLSLLVNLLLLSLSPHQISTCVSTLETTTTKFTSTSSSSPIDSCPSHITQIKVL